jgi:hypothetical protein
MRGSGPILTAESLLLPSNLVHSTTHPISSIRPEPPRLTQGSTPWFAGQIESDPNNRFRETSLYHRGHGTAGYAATPLRLPASVHARRSPLAAARPCRLPSRARIPTACLGSPPHHGCPAPLPSLGPGPLQFWVRCSSSAPPRSDDRCANPRNLFRPFHAPHPSKNAQIEYIYKNIIKNIYISKFYNKIYISKNQNIYFKKSY